MSKRFCKYKKSIAQTLMTGFIFASPIHSYAQSSAVKQGNQSDINALMKIAESNPLCANPVGNKVVNVKAAFGFVADGVADDYPAWRRFADAISCRANIPGGTATHEEGQPPVGQEPNQFGRCETGWTYVFPKGTYTKLRPASASAPETAFVGVTEATFLGCGSTVSVGGVSSIEPTGSPIGSNSEGQPQYRGSARPLRGFQFVYSNGINLTGMRLMGNASNMKLSEKLPNGSSVDVVESGSSGIESVQTKNSRFGELMISGFDTDGIRIGGLTIWGRDNNRGQLPADQRIDSNNIVENTFITNNGRNGISIISANGVTIRSSTIVSNGQVSNLHAGHAPRSGIVIEPNPGVQPFTPLTTNVVVSNATVTGNFNSQVITAREDLIERVSIVNSIIDMKGVSSRGYSLRLNIPQAIVQNSTIETSNGLSFVGCVSTRWCNPLRKTNPATNRLVPMITEISGSAFISERNALKVNSFGEIRLLNNVFRGSLQGSDPVLLVDYRSQGLVEGNSIEILQGPGIRTSSPRGAIFRPTGVVRNFRVANNVYQTNVRPLNPRRLFLTVYHPSTMVCGDLYPSISRWIPQGLRTRGGRVSQGCR